LRDLDKNIRAMHNNNNNTGMTCESWYEEHRRTINGLYSRSDSGTAFSQELYGAIFKTCDFLPVTLVTDYHENGFKKNDLLIRRCEFTGCFFTTTVLCDCHMNTDFDVDFVIRLNCSNKVQKDISI